MSETATAIGPKTQPLAGASIDLEALPDSPPSAALHLVTSGGSLTGGHPVSRRAIILYDELKIEPLIIYLASEQKSPAVISIWASASGHGKVQFVHVIIPKAHVPLERVRTKVDSNWPKNCVRRDGTRRKVEKDAGHCRHIELIPGPVMAKVAVKLRARLYPEVRRCPQLKPANWVRPTRMPGPSGRATLMRTCGRPRPPME